MTVALAEEGSGVLSDVDVRAAFREKADAEYRNYRILGVCNPPLATEALEGEIGLRTLLPCNLVVYDDEDGRVVAAFVDPAAVLSVVENPDLDPVAADVTERFERVRASL